MQNNRDAKPFPDCNVTSDIFVNTFKSSLRQKSEPTTNSCSTYLLGLTESLLNPTATNSALNICRATVVTALPHGEVNGSV